MFCFFIKSSDKQSNSGLVQRACQAILLHYLVWFGLVVYVCPHRVSAGEAHYENSFEWRGTRNICHKHQHTKSLLKLLFNKTCSQETHKEIYARAGTKQNNQEPPWEYEQKEVAFLKRSQQKELIHPSFPDKYSFIGLISNVA